jgi:hypothetical protein
MGQIDELLRRNDPVRVGERPRRRFCPRVRLQFFLGYRDGRCGLHKREREQRVRQYPAEEICQSSFHSKPPAPSRAIDLRR